MKECKYCNGFGYHLYSYNAGGRVYRTVCEVCKGSGKTEEGNEVDLHMEEENNDT